MKKIIFSLILLAMIFSIAIAEDGQIMGCLKSGVYFEGTDFWHNYSDRFSVVSGVLFEGIFIERRNAYQDSSKACGPIKVLNIVANAKGGKGEKKNTENALRLDKPAREKLMKSEVWLQTTLNFRNGIGKIYGGTGGIVKIATNDKEITLWILTSAHVVGNAMREIKDASVSVTANGYAFPAQVMRDGENYAVNWNYEMIMIKAIAPRDKDLEDSIQSLDLSQKDVEWGINVNIAGFPAKIPKATEGYISMLGNLFQPIVLSDGTVFYVMYLVGIETYGIIMGGISGGAVVDEDGKLTAVIWGGFEGESFALATPIDADSRAWINEWLSK